MYILLNYDNNTKDFTILDTKDSSVETLGINTIKALADKDISLSLFTFYSGLESYRIKEMLLNPFILYNFVAVTPLDTENYISLDGRKTFHINKSLRGSSTKGLPENLLKEWDYEKNGDLNPLNLTYGSARKVWWLCVKSHSYQARIGDRSILGRGCPYCAGRYAIKGETDLATTNPDLIKEWDYKKNNSTPETAKSTVKYWWKCQKGHSWQADIHHRKMGKGCPYCSGRYAIQGETDLATVHPELVLEWHPSKNGNLTPTDVKYGSGKKVWWKCRECGHEWQATISRRSNGNGCPVCGKIKNFENRMLTIVSKNNLEELRPDLASEWNYEKNKKNPRDFSAGSNEKVWWRCTQGHEWQARICVRNSRNTGCPYCSGSKTEHLTYNILKDLGIDYTAEKKFTEYLPVSYYPFDVWIPDKRLIIELDGMQHFTDENEYFEKDTPYTERRKHDNLKNNFCLNSNIPILRIPCDISPDTDSDVIEFIVKDFVNTRLVPDLIIKYYSAYSEDNNYAEVATKLNKYIKSKQNAALAVV